MVKATLMALLIASSLPEALSGQSAVLDSAIGARLARDTAVVSVVVRDPVSGLISMRRPDLRFHAASTMKVPVLVELARQVDAGTVAWNDPWQVRNRFASIVDGSPYRLDPAVDSDSSLYAKEGTGVAVGELARLMIVRSSNLATNILIERLDPKRVTATARALGADSIEVLRGVEDGLAFQAGRNNTTTARDLATLLLAIADGGTASAESSRRMLAILEAQEFNDGIPAGLPPGTRVAHKTGEITAVFHDAALVYPPDGRPYAIVVLTRGYADREAAMRVQQDLARIAHAAVLEARRSRAP